MDTIRAIVEALWNGFWSLVQLLEPFVGSILGRLLDVDVAPGGATTLTAAFLLVGSAFLISKLFFNLNKSAANGPMKIVLTTDKSPAQVVAEDREKHLKALLGAGAIVAIAYLLAR